MKKIIMNKVYDTRTAQRIALKYSGTHNVSLYQKRTGEYFLYHGYSDGGEAIEPLKYEAAREWGSKNMSADEFRRTFGGEGRNIVTSVSMKAKTYNKLKELAARYDISMGEALEKVLDIALDI